MKSSDITRFGFIQIENFMFKSHSTNNWKKSPDNCKSISDPNQTYMVNTPMDPDHKNRETRLRPQKWAGLGGGQS